MTAQSSLLKRLRQEAVRNGAAGACGGEKPGEGEPDLDAESAERLAELDLGADLHRFALTSDRGGASGRGVLAVKRALRQLLHPVLARQVRFNQASAELTRTLLADLRRTRSELADATERLDAAEAELAALAGEPVDVGVWPADERVDVDLKAFADRFRGPQDLVAERQRPYVALFPTEGDVLDIGCGRGEFLALLASSGRHGWGVDSDPELVAECVAAGRDAVVGDGLAALERVVDGTLAGVFCAHVVEHMPVPALVRLVRLAARKIASGGVLVIETPNPEVLVVLAKFRLDPTHMQPVHPELLRWLAEHEGFTGIELWSSGDIDDEPKLPPLPARDGDDPAAVEAFNAAIAALNHRLYGPRDFALVARRP